MFAKRSFFRVTIMAVAVGVILGTVGAATGFAEDPEANGPAWIRADGTIDPELVPPEGIPVINTDGNLLCYISLDTYLNIGGAPGVDIVTEADTPANDFESDISSSHTDVDEKLLDEVIGIEVPKSEIC